MPHQRGEPIKLRADIQNRLEDFALSKLSGGDQAFASSPFAEAIVVRASNTSVNLIDRDATAQLGTLALDPDSHLQARRVPAIDISAPTLASIGRFVIAQEPIAPGKFGRVAIAGVCVATVKLHHADDGFATIDPQDPKRLRSSDTGEAKIIAKSAAAAADDTRLCLIRFGYANLVRWRYRRVSGAVVNLVRLDGDDYYDPAEVTISIGVDDITDEGYCSQIGHQFAADPKGSGSGNNLYGFELTAEKFVTSSTVNATIYELDGENFGSSLGVQLLHDPAKWYGPADTGTRGLCFEQAGKFYAIQSACGPAEYL